jgi:hypothetical protein
MSLHPQVIYRVTKKPLALPEPFFLMTPFPFKVIRLKHPCRLPL